MLVTGIGLLGWAIVAPLYVLLTQGWVLFVL